MALDKKDFTQIKKIVDDSVQNSEKRLNNRIGGLDDKISKTEGRLNDKIERLDSKIEATEDRIISVISREITDLAEINRAVIERVDKIAELEKRVMRIEHKIGIVSR